MSIAQSIENAVKRIPKGQIFGYDRLPAYEEAPAAVQKAISRLLERKRLLRFSKGKFYKPEQGILGLRKPSDGARLRSILFKKGKRRGYVTGYALFNNLGFTTQVPWKITVALNGGRQTKDFGNFAIRIVRARAPVTEENAKLLGYLDILKDIKKIPDADVETSLRRMEWLVSKLTGKEWSMLVDLALLYYTPQTRALLGLIGENLGLSKVGSLKSSLNPNTVYKLGVHLERWPRAAEWRVC